MTATPFIAAILTYLLMLAAFYWHRIRQFHVAIMGFVILFDIAMPFYLASTRDWGKRLLGDGDILSFGVWMHFGFIIALFVLYGLQIYSASLFFKNSVDERTKARKEHRLQAKGILLARALVITTGALLYAPETVV